MLSSSVSCSRQSTLVSISSLATLSPSLIHSHCSPWFIKSSNFSLFPFIAALHYLHPLLLPISIHDHSFSLRSLMQSLNVRVLGVGPQIYVCNMGRLAVFWGLFCYIVHLAVIFCYFIHLGISLSFHCALHRSGQSLVLGIKDSALASLPGFKVLPLRQFGSWGPNISNDFDPEKDTYVLCHHGMRSLQVAQWLQTQGFKRVFNISGGIHAYAVNADASIPIY